MKVKKKKTTPKHKLSFNNDIVKYFEYPKFLYNVSRNKKVTLEEELIPMDFVLVNFTYQNPIGGVDGIMIIVVEN